MGYKKLKPGENGYYDPTSIPQAIQQKKNRRAVEARIRMAKKII